MEERILRHTVGNRWRANLRAPKLQTREECIAALRQRMNPSENCHSLKWIIEARADEEYRKVLRRIVMTIHEQVLKALDLKDIGDTQRLQKILRTLNNEVQRSLRRRDPLR